MIYVGLDPSFSRTGLALVDSDKKEVSFTSFSCSIGEKQFENVFRASKNIVMQIKSYLEDRGELFHMVMECPLPSSMFSPGLYCLDTIIYGTFEKNIDRTYLPTHLVRIHGKRNHTKKESVDLAMSELEVLKSKGYVIYSKRINHDCAEAFLYLFDYYGEKL